MIGMDVDHCQIVSSGLNQSTVAREEILASMTVLNERLERVRSLGGAFAGISFSSDVDSLNHWAGTSVATPTNAVS